MGVNRYEQEVLSSPFATDLGVKAPIDATSPSTAAALAYMKSVSKDGLCGRPTEVYIQTIFDGKSKEEANAAATRVYIEAYNNGERLPTGGACAAADIAFRDAWKKGEDPVLESALAFVNAWPGVDDGNPCAVSAIDYVKAIVIGKSHLEANTLAMTGFANAFKLLSLKQFQKNQILLMLLHSTLSPTRSLRMELLLLILSVCQLWKVSLTHTVLVMTSLQQISRQQNPSSKSFPRAPPSPLILHVLLPPLHMLRRSQTNLVLQMLLL